MSWKPMLATNAKLDKMKFPIYSSLKLEGVRGEFTPMGLFTRPMKRFNNKLLESKFSKILKYCAEHGVTLEGEFYRHGVDFSTLSSICRRANHPDTDTLNFYVFDIYFDGAKSCEFEERLPHAHSAVEVINDPSVFLCKQYLHKTVDEVLKFYDEALEDGYEGWVGKDPKGTYKAGRSTVNEGKYVRLKPEETFDGVVIEIVERFENLCESETNELGYMSKKQDKDMKASTGLAAVAIVDSKAFSKPVRVSLSRGILDYQDTKKSPSRASIFANKADYIGKNIRFVGFTISGMDLPRSPRFDDWRTDLD
ncbi:MAG: hypothetical protein GY804_12880 [Alphaproteobacteria bacterium]|nr:hypothetical protein [Lentisphaerota bacterium]MCP4395141.1 hypothetical protein [Alphaproteobacteria bacterium]